MKLLASTALLLLVLTVGAAEKSYFPKDSMHDAEQQRFAEYLDAMKEPVLAPDMKDQNYFAFRVFCLPSMGWPVSVRFEKKGGEIIRRYVVVWGSGSVHPGQIIEDKTDKITEAEFALLLSKIETSRVWTLASHDDVNGIDGSDLVIEGVKGMKHMVFKRWTPEHETKKRGLSAVWLLTRQLFSDDWRTR